MQSNIKCLYKYPFSSIKSVFILILLYCKHSSEASTKKHYAIPILDCLAHLLGLTETKRERVLDISYLIRNYVYKKPYALSFVILFVNLILSSYLRCASFISFVIY